MSFAKQHGVMKSITTFLTGLFRSLENSPEEPVSPGKQEQNNQTASAQQTVSGEDLTTGPEPEGMDQWFPAAGADDEQERCGQEEPEARTEDDIITGGSMLFANKKMARTGSPR
ncbi:MAG: hypothetical protein WGN25_01215 [Candidatus Electrothrix sp. GW3-4]|uniref:hypothetical protein n=1 Tax=Candidatus Electrothrix sp. GW3-4 TaxID=3126740 RepID=UPI0030CCD40E